MENENLTEEQLREAMENEAKKMEEMYDNLFEEMEKGGYFDQTYSKDSKVEIPGSLFNSFIWFVNDKSKHINSMRNVIKVIDDTLAGLSNNINHMTMNLMEQHKNNVDAGATISVKDQKVEDAKEEIVEVKEEKPKNKKKARIKVAE